MSMSRREFLRAGSSAGLGLVLGFRFPVPTAGTAGESPFEPNAYVRIDPEGAVTLWIPRAEMGQGVRTALAMVLADELEVDLAAVRLEQAEPDARFAGVRLRTSGSGSSAGTFTTLRQAGAAAREMLVAAAAARWGVDGESCRASSGAVVHLATGRRLDYGALASAAAALPVPAEPRLKERAELRLIGTPVRRVDGPDIVTGRARYGLDVRRPGMLVAAVARSPRLGGSPGRIDARGALAVDGVRDVIRVSTGLAQGVAVVAEDTWAAFRGKEALAIYWEPGPGSDFDSERFLARLEAALDGAGYVVRRDGDPDRAFATAARRLEATYVCPFQAHAPLETMNCTAEVRPDRCEIWAPTQTPDRCQEMAARILGLALDRVKVHTILMGGGFGRRLFADYAAEAVEIASHLGRPVQVVWTREDDMRHGFFQPASVERLAAAVDERGRLTGWWHVSASSDHTMPAYHSDTPAERPRPDAYAADGSPWGSYDTPYAVPALAVDYAPVPSPVPVGPWRAVEYPPTVFARESFVDEVAAALGKDPVGFRLELLEPEDVLALGRQRIDRGRLARVLRATAEKAGWGRAKPRGDRMWGRGAACNVYHGGSYVAQVAEVSVARDLSDLRVERIVCGLDCGLVINPLGLEGQVESGIAWALSATLYSAIDFREGAVLQKSYADYPVLGLRNAPRVETLMIAGADRPAGFGEHAVPPVAPAIANAIYDATGRRARRLPITAQALRATPAPGGECGV